MFGSKRRAARRQREAEQAAAATKSVERERELTELFDRAEQGDHDAQDKIIRIWGTSGLAYNLPHSLRPRINKIRYLDRVHTQTERLTELLDTWHSVETTAEELDALKDIFLFLEGWKVTETERERLAKDLGFSWSDLKGRLLAVAQQHYETLLASRDDPDVFTELWRFIKLTRKRLGRGVYGTVYVDNELRKIGVRDFAYPDDWNDLVARFRDTPSISAFRGLPERGPGDVRLLADEAVESDDLTNAQIALAYCNSESRYREAVGDVLTAQLARVVNRHRSGVTTTAGSEEESI